MSRSVSKFKYIISGVALLTLLSACNGRIPKPISIHHPADWGRPCVEIHAELGALDKSIETQWHNQKTSPFGGIDSAWFIEMDAMKQRHAFLFYLAGSRGCVMGQGAAGQIGAPTPAQQQPQLEPVQQQPQIKPAQQQPVQGGVRPRLILPFQ
ncbi:MAG: hypothetical protein HQL54_00150 [Magnetococcales bacterium]|nr:hypothetical protein [Magnetococcales bacterium]